MTETQEKAREDLKSIIAVANDLIKRLEEGTLDGIEEETLEIYYKITDLDFN